MSEKKQNKFMNWMMTKFAPAMQKVIANPWVAAVADAWTRALPIILTGSLIFFYNVFRSYIPALPNLDAVKDFSFGFLSLFLVFIVPFNLMEKKGLANYSVIAGFLGIAVYCLVLNPTFDENYFMNINYGYFGPTGSFACLVIGEFVACVFYNWTKHNFLEDSALPDFVAGWINNIVPIVIALLIAHVVVGILKVDVIGIISTLFSPIAALGGTYIGFVLLILIPTVLYSLGISSWAFGAVSNPIYFANIAANIAAVEAGQKATMIATSESTFTAALITLGGMGCTLPLVVMALLRGKSKKMKTMGRVCIAPSIFNINEPVVYGFPITFNPTLMVPMWLCSLVGATIEYAVMKFGLLNIPAKMIQVGQVPAPLSTVMITEDMRGILWWAVLFVVYWLIYAPFFKAYDRQCLEEENKVAE
ncbi:MAG: PTS sugar transporter subunit IIC [Erysipelotrichaceae bacterium]|nr:PTS sugar transporter subunit IIC [Erysipelotrichaceae bacterium]